MRWDIDLDRHQQEINNIVARFFEGGIDAARGEVKETNYIDEVERCQSNSVIGKGIYTWYYFSDFAPDIDQHIDDIPEFGNLNLLDSINFDSPAWLPPGTLQALDLWLEFLLDISLNELMETYKKAVGDLETDLKNNQLTSREQIKQIARVLTQVESVWADGINTKIDEVMGDIDDKLQSSEFEKDGVSARTTYKEFAQLDIDVISNIAEAILEKLIRGPSEFLSDTSDFSIMLALTWEYEKLCINGGDECVEDWDTLDKFVMSAYLLTAAYGIGLIKFVWDLLGIPVALFLQLNKVYHAIGTETIAKYEEIDESNLPNL